METAILNKFGLLYERGKEVSKVRDRTWVVFVVLRKKIKYIRLFNPKTMLKKDWECEDVIQLTIYLPVFSILNNVKYTASRGVCELCFKSFNLTQRVNTRG